MRYSQMFGKGLYNAPSEEVAVNAQLLLRGGFIDKLMAGSYSLLPLGRRVEQKIEQVIREEMNKTGAGEILMPLLHPKSIWNETGRWESAKEVMYQFEVQEKEYALSFTHEEIFIDLVRKHAASYKDYPVKLYQFSTKFRNEARAKSGILRGREFIMKDLYSLHTSEQEFNEYYWKVAEAYAQVFKRVQLQARIVEAAGGVFTKNITHEFQVFTDVGEDEIYYCEACDFAQNKEIIEQNGIKAASACPKCKKGMIKVSAAIEVGNIFKFGTYYSEKMGLFFTNEKGEKKIPYFGSYGIGITRLMGTIVELHHDEKGIIWPEIVAPYKIYIIGIGDKAKNETEKLYKQLTSKGVEVLYDDREDKGPGEKFAEADLIGIPYRIVISDKTLAKGSDMLEIKKRAEKNSKIISVHNLDEEIQPATVLS